MPVAAPARSPWLRQLPPMVAAEIRRRRGELLAGVAPAARLLDLDDPAHAGLLDGSADVTPPDEERYDVILTTGRLVSAPDLLSAVRGLVARLAPGGALLAVEPVGRAGTIGLLTGSAGTLLPGTAGLHLNRDVPAAVRATGLTLVDLERFIIPTVTWTLRRFVQFRAIDLTPGRDPGFAPGADEPALGDDR